MTKTLLVDIDSVWGNLALMRLSTDQKKKGNEVSLVRLSNESRKDVIGKTPVKLGINSPMQHFDEAYVSCLFTWNMSHARSTAILLESMGVKTQLGGSGIDLKSALPENIQHLMPDYSLYNLKHSMGFLTRGCNRNCPWCIVTKKEGPLHFESDLSEFMHPSHSKVIFFDNNFLQYEGHKKILISLIENRIEFCFNQGLDIRLIDQENANLLSLGQHRDSEFKTPRLYFSWDSLGIENEVTKGLETLRRKHIHPGRCFFYVLCGFNVRPKDYTWDYFFENDWYRFETLRKLGTKPFIMKYNRRRDIPLLNAFSRWVNFMYKARRKELGDLGSFKSFIVHDYPKIAKDISIQVK